MFPDNVDEISSNIATRQVAAARVSFHSKGILGRYEKTFKRFVFKQLEINRQQFAI